jgi:hypothetical protein
MRTTCLHLVAQQTRRAMAAVGLGAAVLLTACGGGADTQEAAAQIQKPEITRYHKLSQTSTATSPTVQLVVRSVGLIKDVSLVSPAVDGLAQSSQALAFRADGNHLTVQLPSTVATSAMPGWMLVVTDDAGMSSAAMLLQLDTPATASRLGQ